MKAGAVEFLTKPFRDQNLLDAIHIALERDRARRQREAEIAAPCGSALNGLHLVSEKCCHWLFPAFPTSR
jgi:FixJ family two-component response regulator